MKYHNVIENIVAYVLEPSMNAVTEDEFLNCLHEKMVNRIEETTKRNYLGTTQDLFGISLHTYLQQQEPFFFKKYLWKIAAYSIWFAKIMPNLST